VDRQKPFSSVQKTKQQCLPPFIKERLIVKVFKQKIAIYSAILAVFKREQNQILALLKIVFSLLLLSNA